MITSPDTSPRELHGNFKQISDDDQRPTYVLADPTAIASGAPGEPREDRRDAEAGDSR